MRLSTRVRSAPRPASRRARLEPIKPNPPVIRTLAPSNAFRIDGELLTTSTWVSELISSSGAAAKLLEDPVHGFLWGLLVRADHDLRIIRRLVGSVDSRKPFEFPSARLFVETLRVALFAHRQRSVHKDFHELSAGLQSDLAR